jgi:hypothetical protein
MKSVYIPTGELLSLNLTDCHNKRGFDRKSSCDQFERNGDI